MSSHGSPRSDPEVMNQFILKMLEEIHIAVGEKPEEVLLVFMDALTDVRTRSVE